MRRTLRTIVLLSGVFALALSACKGSTKGADKPPVTGRGKSTAAKPEDRTRCDVKGKRIVKLDINQDKQPDVWKLYKTRVEGGAKVDVLTCKERDLNFDGRKDIWYYYDDDGNLRMEEMDLDFDGRIDLVTIRRGGKVIRQELDTNYNARSTSGDTSRKRC